MAEPPGQQRQALAAGRRVLRLFLYQRELTPILITVGLFTYFTIRAGSTFTDELSLSSAAGYAGPIAAIAVGEVLLLVLAEIDLSAGQVFLFAPWVEYWLNNLGVPVALAILCAGAARVANRGPDPLTLDAARVSEVANLWPDALIVPVHIDDWAHFSEPRATLQENWSGASGRLRILEPGVITDLA